MYDIQSEYLLLLKNCMNRAEEDRYRSIVENISVFWHSHRETVNLFLNYIPYDFRTYVYTSVALRVEYKDIYPFSTLGDLHILEDPLTDAFRGIISKCESDKINSLKKLVDDVIPAHIEVLENYMCKVLIMPMGFRNSKEYKEIYDFCTRSFFGMFRENFVDLKDYLTKVSTMEDIFIALKEEYKNNEFIFSKEKLKEWQKLRIIENRNAASDYFYYTTFNQFRACVITFNYLQFGITPYIPNLTTLCNTVNMLRFFSEQPITEYLIFKINCGYILYRDFPEEIENIPLEDYCKLLSDYDLVQYLDDYFEADHDKRIMPNDIYPEIQKFFDKIRKYL